MFHYQGLGKGSGNVYNSRGKYGNKENILWYPRTTARNSADQNMVYVTTNNLYFKCLISKDT